jgi:RimJ/RimL family protein N-acetyltransferase
VSSTPRVTLRPLTEDDIAQIEPWYGEAARIVHQLDSAADVQMLRLQAAEAADANGEVLVIEREGAPIGYIDYRRGEPAEGWATIGVIAVAAGQRGRGYGAEAVRLLEEWAEAGSFLANVNPRNGLSLYFWLRQGYRPALGAEAFWRRRDDGSISMVRTTGG